MPLGPMNTKAQKQEGMRQEMHRFKHGQLHSGSKSGPLVKNRAQAIAIALHETGQSRKAGGGGVDPTDYDVVESDTRARIPQDVRRNNIQVPRTGVEHYIRLWDEEKKNQDDPGGMYQMSPKQLRERGYAMGGPTPALPGMMPGQLPQPPQGGFGQMQPQFAAEGGRTRVPLGYDLPEMRQVGPLPRGRGIVHVPNFDEQRQTLGLAADGRDNPRAGGGLVAGFADGGTPWQTRSAARGMLHSGPIASTVPGRTDRHNVNVRSGSYVIPADVVSHIGQNNTAAGHSVLGVMFGGGPYGTKAGQMGHSRPMMPKPAAMPHMAASTRPAQARFSSSKIKGISTGGSSGDSTGEPTPIVVAGGEYTVPVEAVAAIGRGNIDRGHQVLDAWVMNERNDHIRTLRNLPPPAKT